MKEDHFITIDEYGNKFYYTDNKMTNLHRSDGPAVEWVNGDKYWWVNGKLHRTDGPAIEFSNGDKWWYIDGVCFTEDKFKANGK